jgi:pimeloyl-ACP methyl ester carboxylesterase
MIARLQQLTTLAVLALATAWGMLFMQRGEPAAAAAGVLLVLFGHALFLGFEFVLLARHGADGTAPIPRIPQLLRAWAAEVLHAPLVFCWRQPFRSRAEPDFLPMRPSGRRGVVLVHGFVCNRGFWNPWMRALRARGIPFAAVNLEPPFGSIDRYPQTIDAAVSRVASATGHPPVIVAHSMGGLAARAWLALTSDEGRVHRVVTIATPHHGTWLARWSRTLNGHEMKLDGPWLRDLEARERHGDSSRFVCFFGHCDNIVFPTGTATLQGADNRHIEATAHVQMAHHPAIMRTVLSLLEGEPSSAEKHTVANAQEPGDMAPVAAPAAMPRRTS